MAFLAAFGVAYYFSSETKSSFESFEKEELLLISQSEEITYGLSDLKMLIMIASLRKADDYMEIKRMEQLSQSVGNKIDQIKTISQTLNDRKLNALSEELFNGYQKFIRLATMMPEDFKTGFEEGLDTLGAVDYWNSELVKILKDIAEHIQKRTEQKGLLLEDRLDDFMMYIVIIGFVTFLVSVYIYLSSSQLRTINKDLEQSHKMIMDSVEYARLIQTSFLPKHSEINALLNDHFIIWEPRDIVGGDMYCVNKVEGGFVFIVMDCTGHGVPGALMTALAVPAFKKAVNEYQITDPGKILSMMNLQIQDTLVDNDAEIVENGLDAAVCYVNIHENIVIFSGAHMPLFYVKSNTLHTIKGNKYGVGYSTVPHEYEYRNHEIHIDEELRLYISTDGLFDQIGVKGKRVAYGKSRFRTKIEKMYMQNARFQKDTLLHSFYEYKGHEKQRDDVTCMYLHIVKEQT